MEVVFRQPQLDHLFAAARGETEIGAAVYLRYDEPSERYLVTHIEIAEGNDRLSATETEFTFAPQFLTRTTRIARISGLAYGLLHSHPSGCSNFSTIDDQTEQLLGTFVAERLNGHRAFSLLVCDERVRARELAGSALLPVRSVGARVRRYNTDLHASVDGFDDRFDRQIRAFGADGQAALSALRVAVVGLGGTGSVLAQQLAHLGVGAFELMDPDTVERSNLNRVVGATLADIGRNKVDVACELIRSIHPNAEVTPIPEHAVSFGCAQRLRVVDCIFMCTDSHVSRAFLSEFAHQFVIPAFDVGVSINANAGRVEAISGRTQMIAPGLACLLCANALDARVIREELMTTEQRKADPYFNSGGVHQPAVISINSTMVSLTVSMFLSAFLDLPGNARWQFYDGIAGVVRAVASRSDAECSVCGHSGVTALGASRPLAFVGSVS